MRRRNPKPTGTYRQYLLGYVICYELCHHYETLNDQIYPTPEKAEAAARKIQHRFGSRLAYRHMCYGSWKTLDLPPWPHKEIFTIVCVI